MNVTIGNLCCPVCEGWGRAVDDQAAPVQAGRRRAAMELGACRSDGVPFTENPCRVCSGRRLVAVCWTARGGFFVLGGA